MDSQLINTHDKFFKALFSNKAAVSEFVQKILPSEVGQKLDVETLALDKTEYVDEELRTHFSDIVYHCDYQSDDGKRINTQISLLFEHKSRPEKYPHLQLLKYLLNVWRAQEKQKVALTPVIPIIFYHGEPDLATKAI